MVSVMGARSPSAVPAAPLNEGLELPTTAAIGVRETAGRTVSTVNVLDSLSPTLPASSRCVAWTVYVPSPREAEVEDQLLPLTLAGPEAIGLPLALAPA